MFSQIVTAARDLLSRSESNPPEQGESTSIPYREKPASGTLEMVTATRRTNFAGRTVDGEPSTSNNSSSRVDRKAKSPISTPNKGEPDQVSRKRKKPDNDGTPGKRKRVQVEIFPEVDSDASHRKSRQGQNAEEQGVKQKLSHVRFGSEDPPSNLHEDPDPVEKDQYHSEHQEDESDDDEAPEAVSNTAQLKQLKYVERKREQAKQRCVLFPFCLFLYST
jgi:U3 small nucleolar RNA-associated protein 16